jgi:hypothetical protein
MKLPEISRLFTICCPDPKNNMMLRFRSALNKVIKNNKKDLKLLFIHMILKCLTKSLTWSAWMSRETLEAITPWESFLSLDSGLARHAWRTHLTCGTRRTLNRLNTLNKYFSITKRALRSVIIVSL